MSKYKDKYYIDNINYKNGNINSCEVLIPDKNPLKLKLDKKIKVKINDKFVDGIINKIEIETLIIPSLFSYVCSLQYNFYLKSILVKLDQPIKTGLEQEKTHVKYLISRYISTSSQYFNFNLSFFFLNDYVTYNNKTNNKKKSN